ncbi:MAG: tripartite tricarboxylate transporter substrate binding protein [Betaproteobacteria bacterium]|nr:MAG: tripartite tricarboxylate transporter substrate binding protein [Betaproteobacteria bacterium]
MKQVFPFRWTCAVALAACASAASAQVYPARPVKILVPFAAGGVADITARVLSQRMSEAMGQQVIVENRPSAGGIVASEAVAKAEPDGHTLLFITNGNAVSASLFKSLPYDTVNDFAPVSTVGFFDLVLVVDSGSKIGSVRELIASARANPSKLNIGTINIGSTQNLAAELFKSMAGIDAQVVPFKATPAVVTALKGNDVQAAFEILAPVLAQIRGGALKPLAVTSEKRFSGLPEVPTVAESGVPGYQASSWNGIAAPARTPKGVIDRLNREVNAAAAAPEVRKRLQDLGVEARAGTPAALGALLASEIAKWHAVIERAKIEKQ